jgi:hypothetical protein
MAWHKKLDIAMVELPFNNSFYSRFAESLRIEIIFVALGEHENILMRACATALDRFRHRIGLVPDYILT